MILAFSIAGIVFALIPAAMFFKNLPLFLFPADAEPSADRPGVSVLIPARNEAAGIGACVKAALESQRVDLEVIVMDDHSCDDTASIVQRLGEHDSRVQFRSSDPLPESWNGKQFACWQLAAASTKQYLVFLDADVRLRPDTLSRLVSRCMVDDTALLSLFPHQQTETMLEKWIVPLMHYVLLGYLPFARMQSCTHPTYAAGCGQLFLTTRSGYDLAGTHESIRDSRHDGLKLPRVYRQAGLMTNVFDGTELADCRMYRSASEVLRGVLKNAFEGIANPRLIVPFTLLLLGGSVLPVVTLITSLIDSNFRTFLLSVVGLLLGHAPRAVAAYRFRQPITGVIFHSVSILMFVAMQWIALLLHLFGRQVAWRGRTES